MKNASPFKLLTAISIRGIRFGWLTCQSNYHGKHPTKSQGYPASSPEDFNPASSPEDFNNISQMPAETHRQTGQFKTTAHLLIGLDNVTESRKCNETVGHGKASVRSQTVLSSMQNGTVGRTELWGLFFPGVT
jgi:hypothetical protein